MLEPSTTRPPATGTGHRTRRRLTGALLAGLVPLVGGAPARAAEPADGTAGYPARPIRILVGYAAGGTGDLTMRLVSQRLGERLGQPVVIENAPSAGGVVASQRAARSTPDGYTLNFIATGNFSMTPSLFKSLPFDPQKDFDMIGRTGTFGFALVVAAGSPLRTVADVLERARARPGSLNIGTVAVGSAQYLAAELFKSMAGIQATTVPYRTSGDVVSAVRSGDVDLAFETVAPLVPQVKAGALRAIAFTESERFPGFPDVPTLQESGLPKYEVSAWNGVAAPAGTPRPIIERLNREINAVLAEPALQAKFIELGVTARGNSPQEMTALLARDIAAWRTVIEAAGLEKQ